MALLDSKFYRPRRTVYARPEDFGLPYEAVEFLNTDGLRLHGWWFPAVDTPIGTVVHCHGNAGNITSHFGHSCWLAAEGFNVLCFDYRGYGRSGGRPSRAGTIVDSHAAIDFARSRPAADPHSILLFGQSLGAAVAIVTAAERRDLAGVAADGSFSAYREEARWVCSHLWYAWGIAAPLVRFGFSAGCDPIEFVERIAPTPLYLFHGERDRVCPVRMSQALFDKAGEPKELWCVPGMGHDQALHLMGSIARPRLVDFFQRAISGRGRDATT